MAVDTDDAVKISYSSILLLALIDDAPDKAYGLELAPRLGKLMGRDYSESIYMMLRRLREEQYIEQNKTLPNPVTRNAAFRLHALTARGRDVLKTIRKVLV